MTPYTSPISDKKQPRVSISERRATYPLQERLKIYCPDSMARRFSDQEKKQGKLIVNGVNILNKTSLDSDTMMHRIKQRRETHNRVERRRRDKLNGLVNELSNSIPLVVGANEEKCHRAKILRHAISYIHFMQQENAALKVQLGHPVDTPVFSPVPLESYPPNTVSPSSESEITSSDSDESQSCGSKLTKKMNPPPFDTFCFQA